MYYYYLPNHKHTINENDFKVESNISECFISKTLYEYIRKYKKQIGHYEQEWDNFKKFTNPYEFIHTPIPNNKNSVSNLKPLSRSFFKMIELLHFFNILNTTNPIKSFHLAEGPGGFVEAVAYKRENEKDFYYGMTLIDDSDVNIPSWKKTNNFIKKNKNFIIENGKTNTGDLLKVDNLIYCYEKYKNSMDLITADGGFDFSENFDDQESLVVKLLLAEIIFAISMQKTNGTFILKIFDIMTKITVDLIYLLSCFYEEVIICKPQTSRIGNSEKYIVCKKFKYSNKVDDIIKYFEENYNLLMSPNKNITSLLNIDYNLFYINKLQEINAIFGQQQIENISFTLGLVNNKNKQEKLENMKRNNIQKCIQWCEKYTIPHEKIVCNDNIFLQNKFNHK